MPDIQDPSIAVGKTRNDAHFADAVAKTSNNDAIVGIRRATQKNGNEGSVMLASRRNMVEKRKMTVTAGGPY
eukprot:scaffold240412_cov17-Prasinocladus_malaysianus.AAC.1